MKTTKTFAALVAINLIGVAGAQSTYNLSVVPIQAQTVTEAVFPGTTLGAAGATYNVGNSITIISGSAQITFDGSFGSEARLELYNSLFPTLSAASSNLFQSGINFTSSAGGPIATTLTASTLTGGLVGAAVTSASTFSYSTWDSFPDNIGGNEGTMSLNFTITAGAAPNPPAQTFIINGGTIDSVGDPSNTILNLGTYTGAPYVFTDMKFAGGSISLTDTNSYASEAGVLLRNSAFPGLGQVVRPGTGTNTPNPSPIAVNTVSAKFLTAGNAPQGYYLNLYGQTIPTGSSWTGELFESFNDSQDLEEGQFVNFELQLLPGVATPYPTGTAPTGAIDLGVINSTTAPEATPLSVPQTALGATELRWFKFTTTSDTNATKFLDIYATEGATATDGEDTDMAIYDSNGRIRATNDDGGQGFLSQFAIGGIVAPRAANTTSALALSSGDVFTGIDALGTLPAGTYYLAVSSYNASFDHGFVRPITGVLGGLDPWKLNFRTNMGGSSISGNLTLLDTIGMNGTESIGWTLASTSNTYTGTVSVADMGSSAYSFDIPAGAPNGNYTLKFKGGTFLSKTLNVTLTGASLTGQNASLKNGDIDQDGEVGPSDFDTVVAQFGGAGDADVDNDGEVGPSDFDTVVANFGIGDE